MSQSLSLDDRPELGEGRKRLALSRIMGKLSGLFFLLAALSVLDGLQTLVRHEFNEVSVVPGEVTIISGMMPQTLSSHTQLRVEIDGLAGLSFIPIDSFKGFWMGGDMWRAELRAAAAAVPGKGTLTVVDKVPLKRVGQATIRAEDTPSPATAPTAASAATGVNASAAASDLPEGVILGQNPALVYSVRIWPSATARTAAEHSFIRRFSGVQPFALAGVAAVCALVLAAGHSLCFSGAEARLARHGVYFIHGIKKHVAGSQAAFAHTGPHTDEVAFSPGDAVLLYDTQGRQRGRGAISGKDAVKGFAVFPLATPPRYAWLVVLEQTRR